MFDELAYGGLVAGKARQLPFAGQMIDVEDADIVSSKEYFNEYELADGTLVKVKCVLTVLAKVVGQTAPDGSSIFIANVTPVVVSKAESS